jgi:hypothetical protein
MRWFLASSIAALAVTVAHAQAPAPPPVELPVAIPRPPAAAPGSIEVNAGPPGTASATRLAVDTATIVGIDVPGRIVSLKRRSGEVQSFKVGPEVTRLSEFAVGDVIRLEYQQGLVLEFQPEGSATVAPESGATTGRSGRDQLPGAVINAGIQATVKVTAIDAAGRLVSFQAPGGAIYQVKAGPRVQLEKLKVGDRLLATYVENVAIKLEKALPRVKK